MAEVMPFAINKIKHLVKEMNEPFLHIDLQGSSWKLFFGRQERRLFRVVRSS